MIRCRLMLTCSHELDLAMRLVSFGLNGKRNRSVNQTLAAHCNISGNERINQRLKQPSQRLHRAAT